MSKKLIKISLLIAVITLLFSGCTLQYGDGLLSLPKLPGEYLMLQKKLDEILSTGAVYAVASTGPNRQAVQLVDLDSDGDDEAIAFFYSPKKGFMVYLYKRTEDGFAEIGKAEGYGTAIRAVHYPVCDASGRLALAISWSLEETSDYGMTVFEIGDNTVQSVLDVQYNNLIIDDINMDGVDEICLAMRANDTYSMRTYGYAAGQYKIRSDVPLCNEVKTVTRMAAGYNANRGRAIYVDSVSVNGGYVTDIISTPWGAAMNETIDHASGSGSVTARTATVFCADVNSDGVLEVPTNRGDGKKIIDNKNMLVWKNFIAGQPVGKEVSTYHSIVEEWYMVWPESWKGKVTPVKRVTSGISRTTFALNERERIDDSNPELLSIYVYSGDARLDSATAGNAKVIGQWGNVVYAYALSEDAPSSYAISSEEVIAAFKLIEKEWPAGGFSQ